MNYSLSIFAQPAGLSLGVSFIIFNPCVILQFLLSKQTPRDGAGLYRKKGEESPMSENHQPTKSVLRAPSHSGGFVAPWRVLGVGVI